MPIGDVYPWLQPAPFTVTVPFAVPALCTGSGTLDADFSLMATGVTGAGRCGVCGQRGIRLYDGQTLVPHAYREVCCDAEPRPSTPTETAPASWACHGCGAPVPPRVAPGETYVGDVLCGRCAMGGSTGTGPTVRP